MPCKNSSRCNRRAKTGCSASTPTNGSTLFLRAELPHLLQAPEAVAGWRLPRVLTLFGETRPPPRAVKPDPILRLVRRGRARFDESALVHEGLVVEGEVRDARRGLLRHERGLRLDAQLPKEISYALSKRNRGSPPARNPAC